MALMVWCPRLSLAEDALPATEPKSLSESSYLDLEYASDSAAESDYGYEDTEPFVSSAPSSPDSYEQLPAVANASALIEEAKQLIEMGDVSEAKKRLAEALSASKGLEAFETVKEEVGKINMDILFSNRLTDDSEMYVVKPGDALIKIANRYKTTVELIMRANGLKNTLIHPGQKLKVSTATYTITVDKSDRRLTVLSGGSFLKEYKVAVGKSESETPAGSFSIENKLENPTWFHAGAVVPPHSPDNILGTRWIGFSVPGYGVHGTTLPESVGTASTSGCIRMYNQDVEELYAIIPVKTWVTITE